MWDRIADPPESPTGTKDDGSLPLPSAILDCSERVDEHFSAFLDTAGLWRYSIPVYKLLSVFYGTKMKCFWHDKVFLKLNRQLCCMVTGRGSCQDGREVRKWSQTWYKPAFWAISAIHEINALREVFSQRVGKLLLKSIITLWNFTNYIRQ